MRTPVHRILATGLAVCGGFAGSAGTVAALPALAAEQSVAVLVPTAPPAAPSQSAPDTQLRAATLLVTASLGRDEDYFSNSPEKVAALVESAVLPLFNLPRMAQRAVALDWRAASPGQQVALIAGFRTLLARTFATALSKYRGQAIEFKAPRMTAGDTAVTVKSIVKQRGAERISIDYDMELTVEGWRIHDVRIAGISLIATTRPIFAQVVRDSGVPGLINSLMASSGGTASPRGPDASGAVPILLMHGLISSALRGGR